jgi:hypothetical protein
MSKTEEKAKPSSLELAKQKMELEAGVTLNLPADFAAAIQERILLAETVEDVFAEADASAVGIENFVDVPHRITGFSLSKSKFTEEGNLPVFAVVEAINLDSGEEVTYSCSAASGLVQLWRFQELDAFPLDCSVKGKSTASGYTVLTYRPLTPGENKRLGIS